jgi:hypothetical protein
MLWQVRCEEKKKRNFCPHTTVLLRAHHAWPHGQRAAPQLILAGTGSEPRRLVQCGFDRGPLLWCSLPLECLNSGRWIMHLTRTAVKESAVRCGGEGSAGHLYYAAAVLALRQRRRPGPAFVLLLPPYDLWRA